jgi:hypothetical protein
MSLSASRRVGGRYHPSREFRRSRRTVIPAYLSKASDREEVGFMTQAWGDGHTVEHHSAVDRTTAK